MEKQTRRSNMSKEDERVLIEEKIYRLQGARPKAKETQGLPAIGSNSNEEKQRKAVSPSSGDRHYQENETRSSNSKGNRKSPQEIISIDNVSLVTARQGVKKLPYCRTNSAPLPQPRTPSRIFPSRSPSRRTPHSAPAQTLFNFQWPSVPEQHSSEENQVASESTQNALGGKTNEKKTEVVRFPYIKQQHHGKSTQSHFNPAYSLRTPRNRTSEKELNELDKRQEDEGTRRPSALDGCRGGRLLDRPKLERNRLHSVSSPPSRLSETRVASAGQIKGQEILTVENTMEENYPSIASFPLRNGVKSKEGQNKSYLERNIRQHGDLMTSRMQQGNEREMKTAMTTGQRDALLYNGKMNDNVQVGDQEMQKYYAPKQKRRDRLLARADSNGHRTMSREKVLCNRLEEEECEEVFILPAPDAAGSRAPQVVSRPLQKATNIPESAARKEKKQSNETTPISCTVTVISEIGSKQDTAPSGIGQRNVSPVSFVSQLIANSQKLTLNDSTESPSLQEKKKQARTLRKKFDN